MVVLRELALARVRVAIVWNQYPALGTSWGKKFRDLLLGLCCCKSSSHDRVNPSRYTRHVLMLPDTDNAPSRTSEPAIGIGVPIPVGSKFLFPPFGIRLRDGRVLRT